MNLPEAHDTARNGAARFGNTWRVFRLPAWPPAVYGCGAGELPSEAHVVATYPQSPVTSPKVAPAPAAGAAQGSLF